jgi:hypothetical protein
MTRLLERAGFIRGLGRVKSFFGGVVMRLNCRWDGLACVPPSQSHQFHQTSLLLPGKIVASSTSQPVTVEIREMCVAVISAGCSVVHDFTGDGDCMPYRTRLPKRTEGGCADVDYDSASQMTQRIGCFWSVCQGDEGGVFWG